MGFRVRKPNLKLGKMRRFVFMMCFVTMGVFVQLAAVNNCDYDLKFLNYLNIIFKNS